MILNLHPQRGLFLESATSLTPLQILEFAERNGFPIAIRLLADGPDLSQPVVVTELPAPYTRILVSARPENDLDEEELLFHIANLTPSGSGDSLLYTGFLDTKTSGTDALFPNETDKTAACLLDVDFLVSGDPDDGRQTVIKQRPFTLYRVLWQGDEGTAPSGNPSYPLPDLLLTTENLATGSPEIGDSYVDIDITAAALEALPSLAVGIGVRKPSAGADNLFITSVFTVSPTTIRAYLNGDALEEGYQVTVFFRP